MATEEQVGADPFLHRLLHAQVSESAWSVLSSLVVESWIRLGGASAALLLTANSADELLVDCCRSVDGMPPQFNSLRISQPWSVLLTPGDVVGAVGETGLIGGLNLQVLPWPDLVSALIIQFPEVIPAPQSALYTTLISVGRNLLSQARDRSVLLPRSDVLEAMAQFAAGAGHEINNPLGSILGQTQILLKSEQATDRKQAFETIGAQAWRVRDMIGNAMLFARPPVPKKEQMNVVEVVQQALTPIEKSALEFGVEIHFATSADEILVVADHSQLSTLISQLVRNSVESLHGADRDGRVTVTLRDDLPGTCELSVVDDGPGIVSDEVRQHLFNPFYSGRSAGRGLGFGLCLAWQIVRMHGGMILHGTPDKGGAAFHVALPCQ